MWSAMWSPHCGSSIEQLPSLTSPGKLEPTARTASVGPAAAPPPPFDALAALNPSGRPLPLPPPRDHAPPLPQEVVKLSGHRNDIVFIEFSHEGGCVATASRDGCVKVGGAGGSGGWEGSDRGQPSWGKEEQEALLRARGH
jgi:hypothetical protein